MQMYSEAEVRELADFLGSLCDEVTYPDWVPESKRVHKEYPLQKASRMLRQYADNFTKTS